MRRIAFACTALAVSLFLSAADSKDDASRLEGSWVMVSLEINGEKVTPDQIASGKLIVEGNHYTPVYEGKAYPETFTLDPKASPKAIDFTYAEGPRKGETVKGIYKFEGDTYVMCRALHDDAERPQRFATRPDSGLALVVWKRAKPVSDAKEARVKNAP